MDINIIINDDGKNDYKRIIDDFFVIDGANNILMVKKKLDEYGKSKTII